jgi:hypothetical protein
MDIHLPSFDTTPVLYWLLLYVCCWGLLGLAIRGYRLAGFSGSDAVFLVLSVVLLGLLRLPSIVFNAEVNPDESQMIAQAMTLRQDPVYFRSVDGTTGGPLNSYWLILPSVLGLPFDFITAHGTAFVLLSLHFVLLFLTAQRWFGAISARLALVPFVFVFGFTQHPDFLHYNGELVVLLLLAGSCYLFQRLLVRPQPAPIELLGLGFLLGMVPFGKLQAVPLAAVVAGFTAFDLITRRALTVAHRARLLVWLVMGGLAFPAFFAGFLALSGQFNDLITFYILGNFQYAGNSDWLTNLSQFPAFLQKADKFAWLVWLVLGVGGLAVVLARMRMRGRSVQTFPRLVLPFLLMLTLAGLYAVNRTGSGYVHYLFLLVGPLLFWLASGWSAVQTALAGSAKTVPFWQIAVPISFIGGLLLALLAENGLRYRRDQPLNLYPTTQQGGWKMALSPVAARVLRHARAGEPLAVWGWRCDYYVQAQMPQAVAENHTIRSVFPHPLLTVYQQRYLQNMTRSRPPVFVDAVGRNDLWLQNRATQGHEVVPGLKAFIAANYQYVDLVDDSRIYVRKDRLASAVAAQRP